LQTVVTASTSAQVAVLP